MLYFHVPHSNPTLIHNWAYSLAHDKVKCLSAQYTTVRHFLTIKALTSEYHDLVSTNFVGLMDIMNYYVYDP